MKLSETLRTILVISGVTSKVAYIKTHYRTPCRV